MSAPELGTCYEVAEIKGSEEDVAKAVTEWVNYLRLKAEACGEYWSLPTLKAMRLKDGD